MIPPTLQDALDRYPFHPAARVVVQERARQRMLDNPEESPEDAVRAAITSAVVVCNGCGLYVAPERMTVTACDICSHPVCPACARMLGQVTHTPEGSVPAVIALCPRCIAALPRSVEDIQAFRQGLLREIQRRRDMLREIRRQRDGQFPPH